MTVQDPILRSFDGLLRRNPLAPLVVSAGRRATAADVDALARAATRHLESSDGRLVGLCAPNGPGFLASLIALLRNHAPAVLFDAQTPAVEIRRTLEALGAAFLLRCRNAWPTGPEDWELATSTHATDPDSRLPPGTAVVKVTSGSTGQPRGVATSSEALLADDRALASSMGLRDEDPVLATVPMSHSYGMSVLTIPALVRGVALVTADAQTAPVPLLAAASFGAAVFPTVPAYLDALVRLDGLPEWPPSLRLTMVAGAPLSPATAVRFRERFGRAAHVFYGASECGGICYDREGTAGERGTVGPPVDGVAITLEPREGHDADSGTVRVRSSACGSGYVPRGDERLAGGSFLTSDLGRWCEGELRLLGRVDDVLNIRGKQVNPREVEAVLAGFPGVREVAVVGVSRPGHAECVLRAVIACEPGSIATAELLSWCRSRLSSHKVPRSLVVVPELPRTPRGKLDRQRLAGVAGAES